jgi:hypothetical protein
MFETFKELGRGNGMSEALKRIEKFRKDVLQELLEKCTPEQQEFFKRIFPKGVPDKDLNSAIQLCERTVIKNEKEGKVS